MKILKLLRGRALAIVGSTASIIGLIIAVVTLVTDSKAPDRQESPRTGTALITVKGNAPLSRTTGSQSPAITNTRGDITINYGE